jgi:hypothetical protein
MPTSLLPRAEPRIDELARLLATRPVSRKTVFRTIAAALLGAAGNSVVVRSVSADVSSRKRVLTATAATCSCNGQSFDSAVACCTTGGIQPQNPIQDLSLCPNRVQRREQRANGCGGEGSIQLSEAWDIVRFTPACNEHDKCYDTCRSDQLACDNRFLGSLVARCRRVFSAARPLFFFACSKVALGMYGAVRAEGFQFWSDAQKDACNCCAPTQACPNDQGCCGGTCLGTGQQCCGGVTPCDASPVGLCCGTQCCDATADICTENGCARFECPEGRELCGTGCCEAGQCCGSTCLETGQQCCGGVSPCAAAPAGVCCGTQCFGSDVQCCGGVTPCVAGPVGLCCGTHCCANDATCCSVGCCSPGATCCGSSGCCDAGSICCVFVSGVVGCCPAGHTCCPPNESGERACCPPGNICCVTSSNGCCPEGARCNVEGNKGCQFS